MMKYFEYRLMVTAADIDDLDHAGNFHYVRWMQEAAIAHSTAVGWSPERHIGIGSGWVVRSHNITYLKPAFEGDAIVIKTWISNIKAVTSLRHYEIRNDEGVLLAKAETDWAFINYRKQKPTRIPADVIASFTVVKDDQVVSSSQAATPNVKGKRYD